MKKNGFTLIELVVVIVVLSILAITAAPRFLSLQVDARNASLEGLKGAIEAGIHTGYGKLAMAGLESLPYVSNQREYLGTPKQSLPLPMCGLNEEPCTFLYGYPDAEEYTLPRLVQNLEGDSDWVMLRTGNDSDSNQRSVKITFKDNVERTDNTVALINNNCYLHYTAAKSETKQYQLDIVDCS